MIVDGDLGDAAVSNRYKEVHNLLCCHYTSVSMGGPGSPQFSGPRSQGPADLIGMDVLDALWLAGLLEGEGSFLRPVPSSPNCPAVRLEMCDRDVVERAARLLHRAVTPAKARGERHRPSYVTVIKGRPATRLMFELAPLLSAVRRAQIRRAVRTVAATRLPARAWRPSVPWLAGLLEGEGTFTAKGRGSWVGVGVEMCDRETVERVAGMLGASGISRDDGGRDKGWDPTYRIKISGNRARPWLATLRPLMGERRRAAIDRALASWDPIRLWPAPIGCVVEACVRGHRSRGLCNTHYMRWRRSLSAGRDPGFEPLR